MKICCPSEGPDPSAEIDSMFGRAHYFVIIDTETGKHEYIDNSANMDKPGGAGIQAATIVANKGVECVASGHVGPKACKVLHEAGIRVFTGANGLVWDALEDLQDENLHELKAGEFEPE